MPRMLAGAAGFEPATLGFGDRCSSQTELRSCVSHAMTCRRFMLAPSSGDGGLINSNTPRIHGSNALYRLGVCFAFTLHIHPRISAERPDVHQSGATSATGRRRADKKGQGGL